MVEAFAETSEGCLRTAGASDAVDGEGILRALQKMTDSSSKVMNRPHAGAGWKLLAKQVGDEERRRMEWRSALRARWFSMAVNFMMAQQRLMILSVRGEFYALSNFWMLLLLNVFIFVVQQIQAFYHYQNLK